MISAEDSELSRVRRLLTVFMGTLTNLDTKVSFYDQDIKGRDPHLSDAFVHPCLRGQFRQLLGCQLLHADFALLNCDLGLSHINLLL